MNGIQRIVDDIFDTDHGRQVVDLIYLSHSAVHQRLVQNRVVDKAEPLVIQQVLHVGDLARGQIVHHIDVVTLSNQCIHQVRADVASPTCH
jgi:hypothetical protein